MEQGRAAVHSALEAADGVVESARQVAALAQKQGHKNARDIANRAIEIGARSIFQARQATASAGNGTDLILIAQDVTASTLDAVRDLNDAFALLIQDPAPEPAQRLSSPAA